jgi:hypothetical protein
MEYLRSINNMARVIHHLKYGDYEYEHFREKGKKNPTTKYVGKVAVVSHIPAKGYPVEAPCYVSGHKAGQEAEKEQFGEKKFNEFEKHINKVIPEGELAGSHTEEGKILIHKNIDPKFHEQLITHEATEHDYMEKKQCESIGAKLRSDKVKEALKHPDVLGAGSKKRKQLKLTYEEHVKAVMAEYSRGTLHTSSDKLVTSKDQALAIAYSEIRAKED